MSHDYATLDLLRQSHPAWRLLRSDHAPLVASFLHRVFVAPNVRMRGIEAKALALRNSPPAGEVMTIADVAADIELPMERPLYTPPIKPVITDAALECGDAQVDVN